MARLRNVNSGAIVNVDDAKVARLGSEWQAVEKKVSRRSKKSESEPESE